MKERKAIVVEDEYDIAMIEKKVLERAGYAVEVVLSGRDALLLLKKEVPDVIILDIHLPDISGIDILNRIRSSPRTMEVMVIVITAFSDLAAKLGGKADFQITKPFRNQHLQEILEACKDDLENK